MRINAIIIVSINGIEATTPSQFCLRPPAEALADLSQPIDPRDRKTSKQGATALTYSLGTQGPDTLTTVLAKSLAPCGKGGTG